jgi:SH3 domain protein
LNIKKIKSPIFFLFFFGLILLTAPASLYADTQYVSDNLIIMMRSGAGGDYKIIKVLKTGTPLEILEEGGEYFKVNTRGGQEGWVLKRYITSETPKRMLIAGLKRRIEKLKEELARLKADSLALDKNIKSDKILLKKNVRKLEKELKDKNYRIYTIKKELKQMTDKYTSLVKNSSEVVKVVRERDKLRKLYAGLSAKNKALTATNESLFKKRMILWFLAGGFVFFFGWVAGQISKKKRSRY